MSAATSADIARLFARAAFGARPEDLDLWTGRPYEDAVDHLLTIPSPIPPLPDDAVRIALTAAGRYELSEQLREQNRMLGSVIAPKLGQRWWLERMRTTPFPLLERVALFWHDHFATAFGGPYPDLSMLLAQNQTIRVHALGPFQSFVEAMTIDPAMLYWLNGAQSTKGKPNENYARELFELFTLGTDPQVYSENDIQQAARALTGWVVDLQQRSAVFQAGRHDTGTKTVLGQQVSNLGAEEHKRIVEIALAQPVCATFLARKLVSGFAYVPAAAQDALVDEIATALRSGGLDMRTGMRTLLVSDAFRYAAAAERKQTVRQPVDILVAAARATAVSLDEDAFLALAERLGQIPFEPPNVGGWPMGPSWLNPVTSLARYDLGVMVGQRRQASPSSTVRSLPAPDDLDGWARVFGMADLTPNTRAALTSYLESRAGAPTQELQLGVLTLLVSSPDWMVI
jgi:uncharacterized protein (DUF1800 family)